MRIATFRTWLTGLALLVAPMIASCASSDATAIPSDKDTFTSYVASLLAPELPGIRVSVAGPLTLALAGSENGTSSQVSLDRPWVTCSNNRDECATVLSVFVHNLSRVVLAEIGPFGRSAIRVVVRPTAEIVQMSRRLARGGQEGALIWQRFAGDLSMLCVADLPHGIRYVNAHDLARLGLSPDEAIALGREHVAATLPPLASRLHPVSQDRPFEMLAGDDYESSRILLHESWRPLAQAMLEDGQTLVVSVPESHTVLYGDAARPGTINAMRSFAAQVTKSAARPISATLFRWTPEGWQPLAH